MSGLERMSFAAYADPERDDPPTPPATPPPRPAAPLPASAPAIVPAPSDVWNPCGGYYAIHRCAQRGCDTSKCRKNGRQFLVRCPGRSQAPYVYRGLNLYKFGQCEPCRQRELAEATP